MGGIGCSSPAGRRTRFETLHASFLDRLVPVCAALLDAAVSAGEVAAGVGAYELMRAVGNLCAGTDARYDARRMVGILIAGLHRPGDHHATR